MYCTSDCPKSVLLGVHCGSLLAPASVSAEVQQPSFGVHVWGRYSKESPEDPKRARKVAAQGPLFALVSEILHASENQLSP